ncbi:hypothetical protein J6590_079278 [Homalodisca vitripennis]|nr:hypothetical protein J6590_097900 [Homalodisca vitripennis]KAG8285495.1 hypothetical protein J6590_079278 [Homalodisca vitripennis]
MGKSLQSLVLSVCPQTHCLLVQSGAPRRERFIFGDNSCESVPDSSYLPLGAAAHSKNIAAVDFTTAKKRRFTRPLSGALVTWVKYCRRASARGRKRVSRAFRQRSQLSSIHGLKALWLPWPWRFCNPAKRIFHNRGPYCVGVVRIGHASFRG